MQTTSDITGTNDADWSVNAAELERLSALVDGETDPVEVDGVLHACARHPGVRQEWVLYQQISEVLRVGEQATAQGSQLFAARVMTRLQAERVPVLEPNRAIPVALDRPVAANDGVFRWKWVAGAASLAAVVTVVWQVVGTPAVEPAAQWAQNSAPQGAAQQTEWTPQGVLVRDPQLEAMLAAHRQYGGQSALQMPAGFLRSATYEVPQR